MSAKSLFSSDATVEYRVIPTLDGGVQWHWILFNTLDKVLGGGTAKSRGGAGVQARRKARRLNRTVRSVRVTGLVTEARSAEHIRDFIDSVSSWMDVAEKSGYAQTTDKFWSKAAEGASVFARKVEGVDYIYTISVFAGAGEAASGGMLIWVGLDFETESFNRHVLRTLLTTEKGLPTLLGNLETAIAEYGENWTAVVHSVVANKEAGVVESAQVTKPPAVSPEDDHAKDFIMAQTPWMERLTKLAGAEPRLVMGVDGSPVGGAQWSMGWKFKTCWIQITVYAFFKLGSDKMPSEFNLNVQYRGRQAARDFNQTECLKVDGDSGASDFVDQLEPLITLVKQAHVAGGQPQKPEFVRLAGTVIDWMSNHPRMANYT